MTEKNLENLRLRLREKDRRIVELLNERARLSIDIGEFKEAEKMRVYDPSRESIIYVQVESANEGPLPERALKSIYREILSASRNLQKGFSVAYLGPEASFTHQAARRHFGSGTAMSAQPTVFDVFEDVERGRADCGVVPVENSLEGSVKMTLDKLLSTSLAIVGDIFLPVSHCLLSMAPRPEDLKKVYSHPQALAQCQRWIKSHLPHCSIHEEESTARAARRVLGDRSGAAIASIEAAEVYGLNLLASAIEDNQSNVTRFFIIGNRETSITGNDKTSLVFASRHEPGSLLRSLQPFADKGINLTMIVSHPVRERAWEYIFFVDFTGHRDEEHVAACLEELNRECTFVKVLGSYPMGETV